MEANNSQKRREALEEIESELKSYCCPENKTLVDRFVNDPPDYTCIRDSLLVINRLVNSALSAPPRNCDRFKTKEEAALAYAEECNAFIPQSILWQIGEWLDWLFAEARGGAK